MFTENNFGALGTFGKIDLAILAAIQALQKKQKEGTMTAADTAWMNAAAMANQPKKKRSILSKVIDPLNVTKKVVQVVAKKVAKNPEKAKKLGKILDPMGIFTKKAVATMSAKPQKMAKIAKFMDPLGIMSPSIQSAVAPLYTKQTIEAKMPEIKAMVEEEAYRKEEAAWAAEEAKWNTPTVIAYDAEGNAYDIPSGILVNGRYTDETGKVYSINPPKLSVPAKQLDTSPAELEAPVYEEPYYEEYTIPQMPITQELAVQAPVQQEIDSSQMYFEDQYEMPRFQEREQESYEEPSFYEEKNSEWYIPQISSDNLVREEETYNEPRFEVSESVDDFYALPDWADMPMQYNYEFEDMPMQYNYEFEGFGKLRHTRGPERNMKYRRMNRRRGVDSMFYGFGEETAKPSVWDQLAEGIMKMKPAVTAARKTVQAYRKNQPTVAAPATSADSRLFTPGVTPWYMYALLAAAVGGGAYLILKKR